MKTKLFVSGSRCRCAFSKHLLLLFMLVGSLFFTETAISQITLVSGSPQSATSTGSTIALAKPSGLALGDVMLVSIAQSNGSTSQTLDDASASGWTEVAGSYVFDINSQRCRATILGKVANATDVAASSFTFTVDTQTDGTVGAIMAFRGVDTAAGSFDITPTNFGGQSSALSTMTAPSITTATANAAVIMFSSIGDDLSFSSWTATNPSLTEIFDVPYNVPNLTNDVSIGAAWGTRTTAGATGNGTVALSGTTRGSAIFVALRRFTGTVTVGSVNATLCAGSTFNLPYTITGTYGSGNVFTAQLSSASGSFASPTTIGTVTSTSSGNISVTIPSAASGSGYRIRIVASSPAYTSNDNGANISINGPSTIAVGGAFATCSSAGAINITSGASATNYSSVLWTSNGSGTIANANSLTTATYTPSASDAAVTLTLTAINPACGNITATRTLTVYHQPTASAGGSATICVNQTAQVSGASASNGTISWTENGAGSITAGATTLTPTYTPAAGDAGNTVTLTMTVSNPQCTAATATYTVNVLGAATANAGSAIATCSSSGAVTISTGSSAANYSSVLWTSNGLGTIANPTSMTNVTYTPSPSDAQTVTLTLKAFGNSPCGDATSTKTLTVYHPPTATAGGSATTCSNQAVQVTGASASNGTISWTENGAGSITAGATTTSPTYTPAAGDAGNVVTLTMTVSNPQCTSATATFTINVVGAPTANAGTALSTCANSGTLNITAGASVSNNTSVQWSSSGNGTFTNANSLTLAEYTPGSADIAAGSVTLTLTAFGNAPCANATATKTLTILPVPVTTNAVMCQGGTAFLSSSTVCPAGTATTATPAKDAGAAAVVGSDTTWNNPTNILTAGSPYAVSGSMGFLGVTSELRASNYGFAIPSGSIIRGIQVSINRQASGGNLYDDTLKLLKSSGVVGNDKSASSAWSTSMTAVAYGSTSDLWGTTWTPAEINSTSFGVSLKANVLAFSSRTATVDYIRITVTYSPPGDINWYTVSSGGTAIGTGSSFNPVGVANSGIANNMAVGTYTYYAECTANPNCRTEATFTINALPSVSFTGLAANYCAGSPAVTLTANHAGGTFTGNGVTDNGNGTASFNPTAAGQGTHNISYSFTGENTCVNTISQSVQILPNVTYYQDLDSDTFGNGAVTSVTCYGAPVGYVTNNTDCNDNDATMHSAYAFYTDDDHDGFGVGALRLTCAVDANTPPVGYSLNNTDCNDSNSSIHASFDFFVDADGDGFGSATIQNVCAVDANTPPTGYALNGTDCNDSNSALHAEFAFYVDADQDGYGSNQLVNVCAIDANTPPAGYSLNATDCYDTAFAINPGHAEVLYNGIDDNCDGTLDENFQLLSQILPSQAGTTLTTISSVIAAVSFAQPVSGYRFKVVNTTTLAVQIIDRTVPHFQLTALPNYDYATTYSISVQLQRSGIWLGYYGPSALVSTPAVLDSGGATQVSASQCGSTLPTISTLIATTSLNGVTAYRFRVTNMSNPLSANQVQIIDRNLHWFSLTMLTEFAYGTTYMIEVAVKTNGTFSGFGSPCQVSSPPVPTLTQCGGVIPMAGTHILTSSLNRVTSYRFEVTDLTTFQVVAIDRSQNWFTFNMVGTYTPGGQMAVRVAVMTAGVWSDFGEACVITAPGAARQSVKEEDAEPQIAFRAVSYPNPYIDTFSLDVDLPSSESVEVSIYDMLGKLVETRAFDAIDTEIQTFGSKLAAGVYNVVVSQGENVKTLRVIKR